MVSSTVRPYNLATLVEPLWVGREHWAAQGCHRYQLVRPCLLRRRSGLLQRDLMVTCPARLQCWIECKVVDVTGAVGGRSRRLRRLNSVEFS